MGVFCIVIFLLGVVFSNLCGFNQCVGIDVVIDVGCLWLLLYYDMGFVFVFFVVLVGVLFWLVLMMVFMVLLFCWLSWFLDSGVIMIVVLNFVYNFIGKYVRWVFEVDLGVL